MPRALLWLHGDNGAPQRQVLLTRPLTFQSTRVYIVMHNCLHHTHLLALDFTRGFFKANVLGPSAPPSFLFISDASTSLPISLLCI